MKKYLMFLFIFGFISCHSVKVPKGYQMEEVIQVPPPDKIDYYTYEARVRFSDIPAVDKEKAYSVALAGIYRQITQDIEGYLERNLTDYEIWKEKGREKEQGWKLEDYIKAAFEGPLSCHIFQLVVSDKKELHLRLFVSKKEADEIARVEVLRKLAEKGNESASLLLDEFTEKIQSKEWKKAKEKEIDTLKKYVYDYQKKNLRR